MFFTSFLRYYWCCTNKSRFATLRYDAQALYRCRVVFSVYCSLVLDISPLLVTVMIVVVLC